MIPRQTLWAELARERQHRKVRARTIVGFWCSLAMVLAFIFGCWLGST